ncbi:hypothetical protein IAU60_005264 [Kwoniella sp. DSM 27419]
MATIHPSRLGLVPGGNAPPARPPPHHVQSNGHGAGPSREDELRRKLMERKNNGDRDRDGYDRERDSRSRERDSHRDVERPRGVERDTTRDSRVRDRDGEAFRDYENRRDERDRRDGRDRSPPPSRRPHDSPPHRSREEDRRDRRPSPSYRPYDGPPPPSAAGGQGYGYGRRDDLPHGPPGPGGYGGHGGGWQNPPPRFGGVPDFERRRQERESNPLSIWPESPKRPYQDEDELAAERKRNKSKHKSSRKSKSSRRDRDKHRSSKRRSKRYFDSESSDETDSEEEERRRRRRKEKERERRRRHGSEAESEDEERRRKRRKSETRDDVEDPADQWVEKGGEVVLVPSERDRDKAASHVKHDQVEKQVASPVVEDDDDDVDIGPQLPAEAREGKMNRSAFANMLPGEGEAMALYAESGQRIPRRGEIGLESDQIEKFEQMGYVMSGSRHQRMNAVRLRKENQVINEAEKRAILKLQREEKEKKEGMIITQFKEMMEENLRKQGINKP